MIPSKNRFHGHSSLRYVYKNGQQVRNRQLVVKYNIHPKRTTPRVSVVVSKKVCKPAVGRNRIRRRLYEIVRHELPLFDDHAYDIVVIVLGAEVRTMPPVELYKAMRQLFTQAGLYKLPE